jgi:hypothetical protein
MIINKLVEFSQKKIEDKIQPKVDKCTFQNYSDSGSTAKIDVSLLTVA